MSEMICIGCPIGCELTVTDNGDDIITVTGNQCAIGERYAREELRNPTRLVTTSIDIIGGEMKQLSVKTAKPIPKAAIMPCVAAVKMVKAHAPIKIGDVVLANAANTGVDVIATREVKAV